MTHAAADADPQTQKCKDKPEQAQTKFGSDHLLQSTLAGAE